MVRTRGHQRIQIYTKDYHMIRARSRGHQGTSHDNGKTQGTPRNIYMVMERTREHLGTSQDDSLNPGHKGTSHVIVGIKGHQGMLYDN